MVVHTLEQRWEILRQVDLQKMAILVKKKDHLFRWGSFCSWRLCKQAKLSHLGHRKPVRIQWKADAPKTSHCLVQILVQRHNWAIFLRKESKERPLQSIAIDIVVIVFLRSYYQPQSWCLLAISKLRFATVGLLFVGCRQKNKCYVGKPVTIDALKVNIREVFGEIHLHTIEMCIKIPTIV